MMQKGRINCFKKLDSCIIFQVIILIKKAYRQRYVTNEEKFQLYSKIFTIEKYIFFLQKISQDFFGIQKSLITSDKAHTAGCLDFQSKESSKIYFHLCCIS